MRITEKSSALFVSKIKDLLESKGATPTRVEPFPEQGTPVRYEYRITLPRVGYITISFYHRTDAVCYSVFCMFNRPEYAKAFGGNAYSGKCNFHNEDMVQCYNEVEDFLNTVKRIDKDEIMPIDVT